LGDDTAEENSYNLTSTGFLLSENIIFLTLFLQYIDVMTISCYCHDMANLQVKNMPDSLHKRLKRCAKRENTTLSDIALEAIEKELSRREWLGRFTKRPGTDLGVSAASLLEEERLDREKEFRK
jgi:plasmid stability protein